MANKLTPLIVPSEDAEQQKIVKWLKDHDVLFYHIPNGGKRDKREAAKFKRLGVQAGVPDLCIPIARWGYFGAYIEVKRKSGGKVSEAQLYWLKVLGEMGYYCTVANGFDDFVSKMNEYLFW
jgi:VRR-NUC domain